jgi:hypothetical protein
MRHSRTWGLALLLACGAAQPARGSMPCAVPDVSLSPATNTTNAPTALRLSFLRKIPSNVLVRADFEDGTAVQPALDGDVLSGLDAPGWYRLHIFIPTADRQSDNRSLVRGNGEFWADVLVGRSEPGVAMVIHCPYATAAGAQMIAVRWSEDVRFQVDPQVDIELLVDGADAGLACQPRLSAPDAGYDGGFQREVRYDCAAGEVAALRVVRSPLGVAGAAARFPPEGEVWALDGWARQVSVNGIGTVSPCTYWQPSLRDRTHANLSPDTRGPSYAECDSGNTNGCGCGAPGAPMAAFIGVLLMALRRSRAKRRAC